MQNAFNMTHPVIPQRDQFVTLEYLDSVLKGYISVVKEDISYSIASRLSNNKIYITLDKTPFTGMKIVANGREHTSTNDPWAIINITFNTTTSIIYSTPKKPYGGKATCIYDSENLTVEIGCLYGFDGLGECYIDNADEANDRDYIVLSDGEKSYNVYEKNIIDTITKASTEHISFVENEDSESPIIGTSQKQVEFYTKEQVDALINALREEFNSN